MFKEYVNIKKSPNRLQYKLFLKLKEDEPMIMLKHSLIFDGRFYGAEWIEKEEENNDTKGLFWYILLERGKG